MQLARPTPPPSPPYIFQMGACLFSNVAPIWLANTFFNLCALLSGLRRELNSRCQGPTLAYTLHQPPPPPHCYFTFPLPPTPQTRALATKTTVTKKTVKKAAAPKVSYADIFSTFLLEPFAAHSHFSCLPHFLTSNSPPSQPLITLILKGHCQGNQAQGRPQEGRREYKFYV